MDELKQLNTKMRKDFLARKNKQLGTSYKSINEYLTDGGKMGESSAVYARRSAAFSQFKTTWNSNLMDYAVATGKMSPSYESKVREMYPSLAGYLDQSPELSKIFRDAVTSPTPPTDQVLRARLQGTKFWQTLTQSKVAWDTATDAERQAALDSKVNEVITIGQNLGVSLNPKDGRVVQLATDAARLGWDATHLQNAVGGMALADSEENQMLRNGQIGRTVSTMLNQYGYPSKGDNRTSTITEWVSKIAQGQESPETLRTYLTTQAKQWYPSFANDFDMGRTFQDVIDPYAQIAASTLEKPKESIDWTDPIYSRAINQGPEKNNMPMSIAEWQKTLRTDAAYGWNETQQANDLALQIGSTLARAFGRVR